MRFHPPVGQCTMTIFMDDAGARRSAIDAGQSARMDR